MAGTAAQPSLQSCPPSAALAPSTQSQSFSQAPQPRTLGGFVVDDDDDDDDDDDNDDNEAEEEDSHPNGNISSLSGEQNVFRGSSTTPQQNASTFQTPSLSRPQSSKALPPMSDNIAEQSNSDNVPPSHSDAAVTSHGSDNVPPPPNLPSHLRGSAQNDSLSASNESRPPTANGMLHSPATMAMSSRLPHDRIGLLEDRIAEDPRGDHEAWLALIDEYKRRNKIKEVRETYDRFLTVFPTTAEQWTAYANWEIQNNHLYQAEQIFHKCVNFVPNVSLWITYLNYVRRRYPVFLGETDNNRKIISDVFDYVLTEIGIDKDAGCIWEDYIDFLKSMPGAVGGSTWQDQQKMDLLRKTYHKAISIPTDAVERLWKDYDVFEMGIDKAAARKFLQEKGEDYMTARSSSTELRNMTRELSRSTMPILPPAVGFEGDVEYFKQLDLWQKWIAWEKDDPLVLKRDQAEEFRRRVLYVYRQATMSLRFWPEIWYEAVEWCLENGVEDKGKEFLERGFDANPESCLLAFKQGDRIEITTTSEEGEDSIKRRGEAIRVPYDRVLEALYHLTKETEERESKALVQAREGCAQQTTNLPSRSQLGDEDEDAEERGNESEVRLQAQVDAITRETRAHVDICRKLITSVWISLMRAMRRVQGKGKPGGPIGGFRQIFAEARKRGKITSEVYTASALIEHYCYNDPAATRIFDRGFKLFPEDEDFATEYIKHLITINDVTNARAVFETSVNKLTAKEETKHKAKSIFALFHSHEALYGELNQVRKLEKRMSALFPEDPQLSLFAQRYALQAFDPCAVRPVISPASQTKPKNGLARERIANSPPSWQISPRPGVAAMRCTTDSPKRTLDGSDSEMPPRKLQRGDSPLKGAAGRRLDAARKTALRNEVNKGASTPQPSLPLPLPAAVTSLLSMIPPAHTYTATRLDAHKMVQLLREVDYSKANTSPAEGSTSAQPLPYYAPPNGGFVPQSHYS